MGFGERKGVYFEKILGNGGIGSVHRIINNMIRYPEVKIITKY